MLQSCLQLAPVLHGTTLPAASYGCSVTLALPDLPPQRGHAAAVLCPHASPRKVSASATCAGCHRSSSAVPIPPALTATCWLEGGGPQLWGAQPGRDGGTQSSSTSPSEQPQRQTLPAPHPVPAPHQVWQGHASLSTAPWTRWVPVLLSSDALDLIPSQKLLSGTIRHFTPCFQPGVDGRWL